MIKRLKEDESKVKNKEEEKNNRKHNLRMGDQKYIYPEAQNIIYKIS